jgi:hypothetical protein
LKLKPILQTVGITAVTFTLLPLLAADYWWIRMFDYPHIQLTILTLVALITYFMRFEIKRWQDYVFVTVLIGCFIFQYIKIHPYTPYAAYEVLNNTHQEKRKTIKLYTSNVLQTNEEYQLLINDYKERDTDIL